MLLCFLAGLAFYCRFVRFDGVYEVLGVAVCLQWIAMEVGPKLNEPWTTSDCRGWVQCLRCGHHAVGTYAALDVATLIVALCVQIKKRAADKI